MKLNIRFNEKQASENLSKILKEQNERELLKTNKKKQKKLLKEIFEDNTDFEHKILFRRINRIIRKVLFEQQRNR